MAKLVVETSLNVTAFHLLLMSVCWYTVLGAFNFLFLLMEVSTVEPLYNGHHRELTFCPL